jgi:hypothetical protein
MQESGATLGFRIAKTAAGETISLPASGCRNPRAAFTTVDCVRVVASA